MQPNESVTHWLHQLAGGDPSAARPLLERYLDRLVRLASQKLRSAPKRVADEEDVALSVFDSFCRGAASGRFPVLQDRNNLWAILVLITARKAANLVTHERRVKRGRGRIVSESALLNTTHPEDDGPLDQIVGREPTPEFAAQVADECRRLLDKLGDGELKQIAIWKMEGHTNAEVAARLDYAEPTVERRLRLIRKLWEQKESR